MGTDVAYYRKRGAIAVSGCRTRWHWTIDHALVTGGTVPLGINGKAASCRAAWAAAREALTHYRSGHVALSPFSPFGRIG